MRPLLFCILTFLSWPSWAAPIVVKSGEHRDFTRLVVYLAEGSDWRVVSEAQGLTTLDVARWTEGFDTSDVFNRIDTQRLKSLTATDDRLVLSLNCDCQVRAEELPQGYVSLDIFETNLRRPKARPENFEGLEQAADDRRQQEITEALNWPVVFEDSNDDPLLDRVFEQAARSPAPQFEAGLIREMARGATLNYLRPNAVQLPAETGRRARSPSELLEEIGKRAAFSNAGTTLRSSTAEAENTCPSPATYAVSTWGGSEVFSNQLASLRADLVSEFDETNMRASRNLMQFYVHYGLLDELNKAITTFADVPDADLLQALGRTVAGENNGADASVGHVRCGGEIGFWSFLSGGGQADVSQDQVEQLVSVFQRLPVYLKELTADRLVRALDEQGHGVASGVIRSTLERADEPDLEGGANTIFSSDLETMKLAELAALVEKNDEASPKALAVYLERSISTDAKIPAEMLELTGAYVHQLSGSPVARRLLSGQIIGLAHEGQISQALDLLLGSAVEEYETPNQTISHLAKSALSTAQPREIAQMVWRLENAERLADVSADILFETAGFLNAQGQPQLAMVVLEKLENTASTNRLRAQALAKTGLQEDAVALLADASVDEIDPRLSEVLVGRTPEIAWNMRSDLTGKAAEEVAWISQNWNDVAGDPAREDASRLILKTQSNQPISDAPIRDAQGAFSDSRETRQVLENLLN